jgi:hypothetical protein
MQKDNLPKNPTFNQTPATVQTAIRWGKIEFEPENKAITAMLKAQRVVIEKTLKSFRQSKQK